MQGKGVLTLYFRPQGYKSFQAEKQTVVIEDSGDEEDSGDKKSIPETGAHNNNNDNDSSHVHIVSINLKTKLPSKLIYS